MNKKEITEFSPIGWQCYINGQYFKIGRFIKVYVYRNNEWVFTSGVTAEQISKKINTDIFDYENPVAKRKYVFKNKQLNENF